MDTTAAGHRLYLKGARVAAPEPTDYWNHTGMPRRQRRRIAARLLAQGRIDQRTADYIGR